MPIDFGYWSGIAATFLLVTGCATNGSDSMVSSVSNWGEANRQTFSAQVIDPAPDYSDNALEGHGAQTAGAIERYRTGKVKQPERVRTTSAGGSSGGGN